MKLMILTTFVLVLSGCAAIDRMIDVAANGVHAYCTATTAAERAIARERFRDRVYPHHVVVACFARTDEPPK